MQSGAWLYHAQLYCCGRWGHETVTKVVQFTTGLIPRLSPEIEASLPFPVSLAGGNSVACLTDTQLQKKVKGIELSNDQYSDILAWTLLLMLYFCTKLHTGLSYTSHAYACGYVEPIYSVTVSGRLSLMHDPCQCDLG